MTDALVTNNGSAFRGLIGVALFVDHITDDGFQSAAVS